MSKQFDLPSNKERLQVNSNQNYAFTLLSREQAHNGLPSIYETKVSTHNLKEDDFDNEEDFQKAVEELSVVSYEQHFLAGDTKYVNLSEPVYAAFSMKAHGTELRLRATAVVARRQVDIKNDKNEVIGEKDDPTVDPFVLVAVDKFNFNFALYAPGRDQLIEAAKKKAESAGKLFTTLDRMASYSEQLVPSSGKEVRYISVEHRALNDLEKASLTAGDFDPTTCAANAMQQLLLDFFAKYTISDDNLV